MAILWDLVTEAINSYNPRANIGISTCLVMPFKLHVLVRTGKLSKNQSGTSLALDNEYIILISWFLKYMYVIFLYIALQGKAKEKYRGMFEIQKSGDKTSSGEIGLDIRTHASPKVRQDQVSGGVSVLCWHAAPVAYVLWKPCTIR